MNSGVARPDPVEGACRAADVPAATPNEATSRKSLISK